MDNKKIIIESIRERSELWQEQYGFYIHYVQLDDNSNYINCHTHGLTESYNHMDLQIVLSIQPNVATSIFHKIVSLISGGKKYSGIPTSPERIFKDNEIITSGIIEDGYPIKFKKMAETGREVLRLLICDENKILPRDPGCDPYYDLQNTFITE